MAYPSISDDNFQKKINSRYKKYKIDKKKKTFKQICYPKHYSLQTPQQFLAQYINPKTPYKGILIFHRIGAGKTCTAINIAEQWKGKRNIVVVVPASLIGNFRNELRSPCAGDNYLTSKERGQLSSLHPSSSDYKRILKRSDKRIDRFYKIYSYNKFVEGVMENQISLKNTLLIVDEVQNMVSEDGLYYDVLYNAIHEAPSTLRIVLLSATPMFDKPIEIALTLNLLRIPYEFPTGREFREMFIESIYNRRTGETIYKAKNLKEFKERIKGYISYYRGAPPYVFPESKIRYVKCEMSDFQYNSYLTVLRQEGRRRAKGTSGILNLSNDFFIGTRIISNVAFPNRSINEKGFKSFKGKYLQLENLKKYSIKFYKIIKRIKNSWGPIFVYSNFKEFGGIKSFVRALEAQGYVNYVNYGEGKKRFAVWSGDVKNDMREEIKAVYNQSNNINGSKLKLVIGSLSIAEGVSLLNCQQVHILEPYWNYSKLQQIIGRAVRYCSHKLLPEEKRGVKVYIYMATHPTNKETVDQHIMKMAIKKEMLINQFETALKEVAVDCTLFKNGNVFKGEPDIKCQT